MKFWDKSSMNWDDYNRNEVPAIDPLGKRWLANKHAGRQIGWQLQNQSANESDQG